MLQRSFSASICCALLFCFSPDFIPSLLSDQTSLQITGWYQDSLPFGSVRVWLKGWNHNITNWNPSLGLEQIKFLVTWVDFCLNESHIKILWFGSASILRITGIINEVPGCLSLINLWYPLASVSQWLKRGKNNLLSQYQNTANISSFPVRAIFNCEMIGWEFKCTNQTYWKTPTK